MRTIPSHFPALDAALGVGGYPRGRIIEVFGPEASGKTTLALHAIAEVQKAGGIAAYIGTTHALNVAYARKLGVKLEDLLISQPDTGEQALEITGGLVRHAIDLIVIDSMAALVPKAEIGGAMGEAHMGVQARLMIQALRKLTGAVSKTGTVVFFVNQIIGGNALRYYASVRLEIRRTGQVKDGEQVIGSRARVKVVKNKVAPPFGEADLLFEEEVGQ